MKTAQAGQVLIGVMIVLLVLLIMTPPLINWITKDSEWTVKQQKSSLAFNLAAGAVERGTWKLKSSTTTFAAASVGSVIAGYNFDVTYQDLEGGTYRIRFSSGPIVDQVTVTAEARDTANRETRAIQGVFQNLSIPGPVLTSGNVSYSGVFEPHWGPIMAKGNITISGTTALQQRFPRKYSKNVVTGSSTYPRDTNGLTPPNTDNLEWWSAYNVPDLPVLDFATLRASATANGTLNYYNGSTSSHTLTGYSGSNTGSYSGCGSWTHECCFTASGGSWANHTDHFYDSWGHPLANSNLIWYWDGNLILTGQQGSGMGSAASCHRIGLYGMMIVRGNLTIAGGDCISYTANVPSTAWREYQKFDTSASSEYPGDGGYHTNTATFGIGTQNWTGGPTGAPSPLSSADLGDLGIRGFLYVGGNLTIVTNGVCDFAGAVWVVGNVTNANTNGKSLIYFQSQSNVPVLNVILSQESWREIAPSSSAWL